MSESTDRKNRSQAATDSQHHDGRLIKLLARLLARRWEKTIGQGTVNPASTGHARRPRGSVPRSEPSPPDAMS